MGGATCDTNGFTCQVGYYKNGNTCTSCGTGVASCDSTGKPTSCQAGYYLNGSICTLCGDRQYTSSSGATVCQTCSVGYIHNVTHTACELCTDTTTLGACGCTDSYSNGQGGCCPIGANVTVRSGFELNDGLCYCNEGYKPNPEKTACIEVIPCPGGSSELSDGQTADGRSTTNVEGCYCNTDTPYWDADNQSCSATPNCNAIMKNSGLKDFKWTVSGNTITWNPNKEQTTDYIMTTKKDLDLQGCDLIVNGYFKNNYKIKVDKLTINLLSLGSGCSWSENTGTLDIKGNLIITKDTGCDSLRQRALESSSSGEIIVGGNIYTALEILLSNAEVHGSIQSDRIVIIGGHVYGNVTSKILATNGDLIIDGNVKLTNDYYDMMTCYISDSAEIKGYLDIQTEYDLALDIAWDKKLTVGRYINIDGSQTIDSSGGGKSPHRGILTSGDLVCKSGDIMVSAASGIIEDAGSIVAQNGNIWVESSFQAIDIGSGTMEASGYIYATSSDLYGIYVSNGTIKAGGGIEAHSANSDALALSGSSSLYSCSDVIARGGTRGVSTFGYLAAAYVKGFILGQAPKGGSVFNKKYNALFINNADNFHARYFINEGDGNASTYGSAGQMNNYPYNYSYTPEWCTQMGY
jgi:hypothetical protein